MTVMPFVLEGQPPHPVNSMSATAAHEALAISRTFCAISAKPGKAWLAAVQHTGTLPFGHLVFVKYNSCSVLPMSSTAYASQPPPQRIVISATMRDVLMFLLLLCFRRAEWETGVLRTGIGHHSTTSRADRSA